MPKLSVKDFSGGLNTRFKSHAIADNEAVEAENIEFTGYALRSANDLDVIVFTILFYPIAVEYLIWRLGNAVLIKIEDE